MLIISNTLFCTEIGLNIPVKDVKITATSKVAANALVTNDQLSKIMDTSDEWITKRTGIKTRHISTDKNTSDLAFAVGKDLLKQVSWTPDKLDLIIVATMSPDYLTPSVSALIQGKLGAHHAVAFDLSAACSGFSYALSVARSMLLANNWTKALVIGAEVLSKLIDWDDRSSAVLFGDGAGGVILETTAEKHFLGQDLQTFGELGNQLTAGHIKNNTELRNNSFTYTPFQMNGREVYRFATHEVPKSIEAACKQAGITVDQIDHYLLHQANSRIIEHVAKRLKQPINKFPINITEYGNTAAASEAILLSECVEKGLVKKGEIIALSGFGGGLTCATVIFKY